MKQLGLIIGIIFSLAYSGKAANFAELESTYLGDGWFQYRFKTLNDPFFTSVDIGGIYLMSFTNRVEYGPAPANCTNGTDLATDTAGFYYDQTLPQTRPYEKVFLVRSSERHFKRAFAAVFTMSLTFHEMYSSPFFSANVVGYATMTNLVPCSAAEADGSPANLLTRIELIKNPEIDELVMIGNSVRGVKYSWLSPSTVRLEASRDMNAWTNIAYIYGTEGSTTWTTNKSLNGYGNIFRLSLVASRHITNLPPLSENIVSLARNNSPVDSPVKVLNCLPRNNGLETTISTQPGLKYKVDLVGINGASISTRFIIASQAEEKVQFVSDDLPSPVFVRATLAP